MLELKNITKQELDSFLSLSVQPWQETFANRVADSIACAYVEPDCTIPLAIFLDEVPIGFLLFRLHYKTKNIFLKEYFIDRNYQSQGFGTDGLQLFMEYAEKIESFQTLYCIVAIGNTWGNHTLENAGFMKGAVDLDARTKEMVHILR